MSTGNPLEQFRRRLQPQATPTAFVALAEEHRRAGRFSEAIAVCRDGLERYPAYASARVTLGRALLDSGDVAAAVTELEHAVAQSPDNLAAARALDAALAALGDVPSDAASAAHHDALPPDLPLHEADALSLPFPASLVGQVLGVGADGPQEFGLGPDWSLPDASLPGPHTPESASSVEDGTDTLACYPHAESPTMCFTVPHPQGEEPAGIWPVPTGDPGEAPVAQAGGARVYSWAIDAPAEGTVADDCPSVEYVATASNWDPLTIDAPLVDFQASPDASQPAVAMRPPVEVDPLLTFGPEFGSVEAVPVTAPTESGSIETPAESAAAEADESSAFWGDLFGGQPAADAPAAFAGWGEDAPPTTAGADRAPWSDDGPAEPTGAWTVPDGPSATWALDTLHEAGGADVTPFQGGLADADAAAAEATPFASLEMPEATLPLATVAWVGSVKSALGEVFALAGHGESLEPPPHASPAVRQAMADASVEAAQEDSTLQHEPDVPPTLASLQQMLDAVRARRAALFNNVEP